MGCEMRLQREEIERHARPGETYTEAELRILQERRQSGTSKVVNLPGAKPPPKGGQRGGKASATTSGVGQLSMPIMNDVVAVGDPGKNPAPAEAGGQVSRGKRHSPQMAKLVEDGIRLRDSRAGQAYGVRDPARAPKGVAAPDLDQEAGRPDSSATGSQPPSDQDQELVSRLEEELSGASYPPMAHRPDRLPIKDEVISMDIPFFSLAKRSDDDNKVKVYKDGNRSVTIVPPLIGSATIFDKDLLIYATSLIMDLINRGEEPPRTFDVESTDFLRKTHRGCGRPSYEGILPMLMRLQGTTIHTNIETGGVVQMKGFGIIESYEILAKKERLETKPHPKTGKTESREVVRPLKFRFTLSEWFYNSVKDKRVLTLDEKYFTLPTAIERRLYEIARRHCGSVPMWAIDIGLLAKKVGTAQPMYQFRESLRFAIKDDRLPRFHIALDVGVKPNQVVFYTRDKAIFDAHLETQGKRKWFDTLEHPQSAAILEKASRGARGRKKSGTDGE